MEPTKKPVGRPISVTDEVKQKIVEGLAEGLTLTAVCKNLGFAPSGIWAHQLQDASFLEACVEARKIGAYALVDDAINDANSDQFSELDVATKSLRAKTKMTAAKLFNRSAFGVERREVTMQADVTSGGQPIFPAMTKEQALALLKQRETKEG